MSAWLGSEDREVRELDHHLRRSVSPAVFVQTVSAIDTLCGYAFVSKRGKTLDMHSLVHLATRIWLRREGLETRVTETAIRRLAAVSQPTSTKIGTVEKRICRTHYGYGKEPAGDRVPIPLPIPAFLKEGAMV